MHKYLLYTLLLVLVLLISSCSDVRPDYEIPAVTVNHFRVVPSSGMAPRFEIGLHIINPNDTALEVKGISYTARLQGRRILVGVADEVPVIDPFNEGDVVLQASADMLSGIRLITDLMRQPQDSFAYELVVKMSVGGFRRRITVEESGEISLTGNDRTATEVP